MPLVIFLESHSGTLFYSRLSGLILEKRKDSLALVRNILLESVKTVSQSQLNYSVFMNSLEITDFTNTGYLIAVE